MKFGVFDHLDRHDGTLADFYEDRLRITEAYDRAGFYAYHLAEHHSTPLGMAPSPSVFLAAVAQRTRQLRFGPLVWAMPLHHPLRLIEEICMLDQLSRGRLEIGFGRGSVAIELEYYGADPQAAQDIYSEATELVLAGLTSKVLDFEGEDFASERPHGDRAVSEASPADLVWRSHAGSAERAARRNLNVVPSAANGLPCSATARSGRRCTRPRHRFQARPRPFSWWPRRAEARAASRAYPSGTQAYPLVPTPRAGARIRPATSFGHRARQGTGSLQRLRNFSLAAREPNAITLWASLPRRPQFAGMPAIRRPVRQRRDAEIARRVAARVRQPRRCRACRPLIFDCRRTFTDIAAFNETTGELSLGKRSPRRRWSGHREWGGRPRRIFTDAAFLHGTTTRSTPCRAYGRMRASTTRYSRHLRSVSTGRSYNLSFALSR